MTTRSSTTPLFVPPRHGSVGEPCHAQWAFTLVELLVVISVLVVMTALLVPAFNSMRGGADVTKSAYDIAGALEEARTYAIANNTYVWVGFFEEDGSKAPTIPATAGIGSIVISIVASKSGTRYNDSLADSSTPPAFGADLSSASKNPVQLAQVGKLIRVKNMHLGSLNDNLAVGSRNIPTRPPVAPAYQVGDAGFADHLTSASGNTVANPTTFTFPLTISGQAKAPQYKFVKIIEFNPRAEVSKIVENTYSGPGPQDAIEMAIQPTHGVTIDDRFSGANRMKAGAAVQVEGLTARVHIFRP